MARLCRAPCRARFGSGPDGILRHRRQAAAVDCLVSLLAPCWRALGPPKTAVLAAGPGAGFRRRCQPQWRLVLDAVPEPAIALDRAGHRRPRQPHGRGPVRRPAPRGGHIASMSRDPDLLAAVEEALDTREDRAQSGCAERVPLERRLLATAAPSTRSGHAAARSQPS